MQLPIKPLFHPHSDPTARSFDLSFSLNPTSSHYCPYTNILLGADINTTSPPNRPKPSHTDVILSTITANADNHLQGNERGKLGRMHKPPTHTTPVIHGNSVIGELYQKI